MHRKCDRNRKRSERRAIDCPMHVCSSQSVSQKYLFTNCTELPQYKETSRQNTLMLVVGKTVVDDKSEWWEAFWCDEYHETTWDQVQKHHNSIYKVLIALPK